VKSEGCLETLKFMAVRFVIAELIVFALTGVVCWFIGWRTMAEYSTGLILAGFAVLFFWVSGDLRSSTLTSNYQYQVSKTVMPNSANQHMQQNMSDQTEMSVIFLAGLIGVVAILLGIVIKVLIYI